MEPLSIAQPGYCAYSGWCEWPSSSESFHWWQAGFSQLTPSWHLAGIHVYRPLSVRFSCPNLMHHPLSHGSCTETLYTKCKKLFHQLAKTGCAKCLPGHEDCWCFVDDAGHQPHHWVLLVRYWNWEPWCVRGWAVLRLPAGGEQGSSVFRSLRSALFERLPCNPKAVDFQSSTLGQTCCLRQMRRCMDPAASFHEAMLQRPASS